MRTRKLLEVLAFLVTLGAAYALWFVPMNIVQELLTLAVGLGVQCGTSVGGEEARRIFAKRFRRMEWILFLVIAIGGNWLIQFALPENARWIMVNGAFPAYLAACMLIRSACDLVCRFAPAAGGTAPGRAGAPRVQIRNARHSIIERRVPPITQKGNF